MTLDDKAGQLLMAGLEGLEITPATRALLRDCRVGGFLVSGANVSGPGQLRVLTSALQSEAQRLAAGPGGDSETGRPGLLLAADQEGGIVAALDETRGFIVFPGSLALGAAETGGADGNGMAYEQGRLVGKQLRSVGIGLCLAPLLEAGYGVRSFGDDPFQASRLGSAVIHGLQQAGVAACAKHFPHACEPGSAAEPAAEPAAGLPPRPFRAAIAIGVEAFLTRVARPDSSILRQTGFGGLILADLADRAEAGSPTPGAGGVLAALEAGADMVIAPDQPDLVRQAHRDIIAAVGGGRYPLARLDASVRRILALKARLGLVPWPGAPDASAHILPAEAKWGADILPARPSGIRRAALAVARASVTLVRDGLGSAAGVLPLHPGRGDRLAVIVPEGHRALAAYLRLHHNAVFEFPYPTEPGTPDMRRAWLAASAAEVTVLATCAPSMGEGAAALVKGCLTAGRRVIWVSLWNPLDFAVVPGAVTCIATYSFRHASLEAMADCLFGVAPFRGGLPVS